MRRPRSLSWRAFAIAVAPALFVTSTAIPGVCQPKHAAEVSGPAARPAGRPREPDVLGLLQLTVSSGLLGNQCRRYVAEVVDHHGPTWARRPPIELRVIDPVRHDVLFVDRGDQPLVYMFPLIPLGNLLATVWESADSLGHVKIYLLNGDNVKVVFDNGTRFTPQFIEASESAVNPFVLLDQGYEMQGNAILPTETEIWQWNPTTEKFVLRATVPVGQRFTALAKLEREAKSK